MSQPATTDDLMPEKVTLKLLDRDIEVRRPKAIQMYRWRQALDKLEATGKAEWTITEAIEMIDAAVTIIKSLIRPEDREWLDEKMTYGDLEDHEVPEFLVQITRAFGGTVDEEESAPNRAAKRTVAKRRKPAKKTTAAAKR